MFCKNVVIIFFITMYGFTLILILVNTGVNQNHTGQ